MDVPRTIEGRETTSDPARNGERLVAAASTGSMAQRGVELLRDPQSNKGTAFTQPERDALDLVGLLPPAVENIETQVQRVFVQLAQKATDLDRYIELTALADTNETLFYRVIAADPARLLPIIYTPTVSEACLNFGQIFRRPRGMYLSLNDRGRIRRVLRNWPVSDVRIVCATSGGRILGLGDLGANGMGIPIGKLQLYTACAGVPPRHLLPVHIDCGTNNRKLLDDPFYFGLRRPRGPSEEMDELVEEFVAALEEVYPGCCLHFEDWAGVDAMRLLDRYRDRVCCYNDDIQGTGGVVLAGLLNALRAAGGSLREQRLLFLGAGAAGIGGAELVTAAMMLEGLPADEARARIRLFNSRGLIEAGRRDLYQFQRPYAHALAPSQDFRGMIESFRPTAIIGVSTCGGAFTQEVIEAMARINSRPIIFALSNPTDHAECTAEEAYRWSQGRAVFASGSPFAPVRYGDKTLVPGQCNNLYVFPAVGLAVYATRARRITDEMFVAAARGVAEQVTKVQLDAGLLFPPLSEILPTELTTAERIAEVIFERGLATVARPTNLRAFLESQLYKPEYTSLV